MRLVLGEEKPLSCNASHPVCRTLRRRACSSGTAARHQSNPINLFLHSCLVRRPYSPAWEPVNGVDSTRSPVLLTSSAARATSSALCFVGDAVDSSISSFAASVSPNDARSLLTHDHEKSNVAYKVQRCTVIELRVGALFLSVAAATPSHSARRYD